MPAAARQQMRIGKRRDRSQRLPQALLPVPKIRPQRNQTRGHGTKAKRRKKNGTCGIVPQVPQKIRKTEKAGEDIRFAMARRRSIQSVVAPQRNQDVAPNRRIPLSHAAFSKLEIRKIRNELCRITRQGAAVTFREAHAFFAPIKNQGAQHGRHPRCLRSLRCYYRRPTSTSFPPTG